MSFRRSLATFVAVLTLLLSVSAGADEARKVSIGISSPSLPAASARIAKEMGLFEQHGLDVRIVQMDSASVNAMALISGSVDFITSSPSDVVVSQARDHDVVATSSVYSGFAAVLVVAKSAIDKTGVDAKAPIATRLKALDGLLIATPSATSPYTFSLKSSAESVGAKVRITFMAQPAMVAALDAGVIQGFVASSPFYARPVLTHTGAIWISGPAGEFPAALSQANSVTLNVRREYAKANPDVMKRVGQAFTDFSKAVNERPDTVKSAIHRLFPEIDAPTLDLLYATEAKGFSSRAIKAADMSREISFVKASSTSIPGLDALDPAHLIFP
jgi:ABC-type nitrate/sulfonate/bicarbonate transport system substrate-binding protein